MQLADSINPERTVNCAICCGPSEVISAKRGALAWSKPPQ